MSACGVHRAKTDLRSRSSTRAACLLPWAKCPTGGGRGGSAAVSRPPGSRRRRSRGRLREHSANPPACIAASRWQTARGGPQGRWSLAVSIAMRLSASVRVRFKRVQLVGDVRKCLQRRFLRGRHSPVVSHRLWLAAARCVTTWPIVRPAYFSGRLIPEYLGPGRQSVRSKAARSAGAGAGARDPRLSGPR
jgi:hypothetical protein